MKGIMWFYFPYFAFAFKINGRCSFRIESNTVKYFPRTNVNFIKNKYPVYRTNVLKFSRLVNFLSNRKYERLISLLSYIPFFSIAIFEGS